MITSMSYLDNTGRHAWCRRKGMYFQADIYARGADLFVKVGSQYAKISKSNSVGYWTTSHPDVQVLEMEKY